MANVADQAITATQDTIDKMDGLLRDTEAARGERRAELARHGLTPEVATKYAETISPEHQELRRKMLTDTRDEIDRDLPKETATRKPRLKPTRQMV